MLCEIGLSMDSAPRQVPRVEMRRGRIELSDSVTIV